MTPHVLPNPSGLEVSRSFDDLAVHLRPLSIVGALLLQMICNCKVGLPAASRQEACAMSDAARVHAAPKFARRAEKHLPFAPG